MRRRSRPRTAAAWLAHAERILRELDTQLWPLCVLRDEAMAVLGIDDPDAAIGPVSDTAALEDVAAWLAARDPAETATAELRVT